MENVLKEWAPLSNLFNKLPTKAQNGLFTQDLKLTCIDVLPDFLAIGTNFGLVYWYDRRKRYLQKLRCENGSSAITVVKIISTVDYMVACGNKDGSVSIFQVPKSHPDSLPESLRPKNKQVERYTVSELHNSFISALEWSKNGMKLFSGDGNGHIVLTEIDFYMHLCKSAEILNEAYEIVQLSYNHPVLLVSTVYRTITCKKEGKWNVSQVGRKDRKILGNFGGIIYQNSSRPNDIVLYCSRPGLRLWVSDITGSVQQTLLFKDILNQECPEVQLINPISANAKCLRPQKEASFGIVLMFDENFVITYSNDVVYVLNPKDSTVIATVSHLRRVLCVASHKDEIFILEGERSLIRLSFRPEPIIKTTPTVPTAGNFLPLTTSIKDLTSKLQASTIIAAIPPLIENALSNEFSIHTDFTSVINAEEATESPKKMSPNNPNITTHYDVSDPDLTKKIHETHKKLEKYNQISTQDFDDSILFKHKRRKKPVDMSASTMSWSSNSSDEKESNFSKPTLMTMSTIGVLPDFRSPETIKNEIENKEKILADILCFDKVTISQNCDKTKAQNCKSSSQIIRNTQENAKNAEKKHNLQQDVGPVLLLDNKNELKVSTSKQNLSRSTSRSNSTCSELTDSNDFHLKPFGSILPTFTGILKENIVHAAMNDVKENGFARPCSYGPPSGSSNPSSITDMPECMDIPMDWKLKNVLLSKEKSEIISDISLEDWEVI